MREELEMSNSPFKGLKDKFIEIKIGEDIIKARPLVQDAEMFITMKKEMNSEDAKAISKIIVNMITRANPEEDKEDIEAYVAMHYGDLLLKVAVVFGFSSEDDVDKAIKKLIQQE